MQDSCQTNWNFWQDKIKFCKTGGLSVIKLLSRFARNHRTFVRQTELFCRTEWKFAGFVRQSCSFHTVLNRVLGFASTLFCINFIGKQFCWISFYYYYCCCFFVDIDELKLHIKNSTCHMTIPCGNFKMAMHPDWCKCMCIFKFADFLNKFQINILKERFYLFSTY